MSAKNGAYFHRLWIGDTRRYPSASEADLALCGMLAFYTRDASQIDRLFRFSDLYREKWDQPTYADGKTYGEGTIAKALKSATGMYTPGWSKNASRG
jgi:putative DNA primase/helicase